MPTRVSHGHDLLQNADDMPSFWHQQLHLDDGIHDGNVAWPCPMHPAATSTSCKGQMFAVASAQVHVTHLLLSLLKPMQLDTTCLNLAVFWDMPAARSETRPDGNSAVLLPAMQAR